MESPPNAVNANTKEFEVTGISRSGRVRKKSSKLLDFQSPDEVERKQYKRTSPTGRNPIKYAGRGRPSLAMIKARMQASSTGGGGGGHTDDADDLAGDDDDAALDFENEGDLQDMDLEAQPLNSDDDDENLDDVLLANTNLSDTDDDGFGELVADIVGNENTDGQSQRPDSKVRKSLYMTEKRMGRDGRMERKDKGKSRCTAYSLWAKQYRNSSKFGKEVDFNTAKRELWANVPIKEKNNWRRKAKIQAQKTKALEKAGISRDFKKESPTTSANANNTFINRPTTSRTKKLAEEKQKAIEDMAASQTGSTTPRRTRSNSHSRRIATLSQSGSKIKTSSGLYAATNGMNMLGNSAAINNNLPTIEPIDAAAHLKLLGESLTIIGDRLKEHEGQIAVSGSLSVLLDSLLCSLGPLLCLTTCLPGMDRKPNKLKENLAKTLDNIAYVMPGL